jgi:hypothetical protein
MFGALTVEFGWQREGEEEEKRNKPKNYNMLPKNSGEMDLQISWMRPLLRKR